MTPTPSTIEERIETIQRQMDKQILLARASRQNPRERQWAPLHLAQAKSFRAELKTLLDEQRKLQHTQGV